MATALRGERDSGPGATNAPIAAAAAGMTVRSARPLGLDRGEQRDAAAAEPQRHRERAPERVGRVDDVRIGEEQPLPARGPHPLPAGPGLADPAWRERLARQDPHPGIAAGRVARRRRGAVARLVVHDDHLHRPVLEGAQAPDRRPDAALLVARRDDHAHGRAVAQGRLVLRAAARPGARGAPARRRPPTRRRPRPRAGTARSAARRARRALPGLSSPRPEGAGR